MDFSRNLDRFIFDIAAEGVFQSTIDGRYLYVNQAMARMFGYDSPEDMILSVINIANQIHADPQSRNDFQERLARENEIYGFEARNKRKDGSLIWTSTNAKVFRDEAGEIRSYFGFIQDITSRKQAESALNETEARYQSLVEQVPAAVYIDAPRNNLNSGIYISPQIESISGYSSFEWANSRGFWPSIIHQEDVEKFKQENDRTNETGDPFDLEYRILHKSGKVVWIRDMASLTRDTEGQPLYWHGIIIDITEQKIFQEALRYSEQRFQKVFEISPIPICITAYDTGEIIAVNNAYLTLSGSNQSSLIGRTNIELGLITEEERTRWLKTFEEKGQSSSGVETMFMTADRRALEVLEFNDVLDFGGRKSIMSIYYDMTEHNNVARALRESEELYRALLENIPAVIFLDPISKTAEPFYINSRIETLLGFTALEWIEDRQIWRKCLHPADRDRVIAQENRALEKGENLSAEYRMIRKDGRTVWVQEEAALIRTSSGEPLFWQGFLLDISKRKAAEEALMHSEERFEKIFHASPLGISIATLQDDILLDANESYCELVQRPLAEMIGRTSAELGIWDTSNDRPTLLRTLADSPSLRERTGKIRTGEGRTRDVLSFYEMVEIDGRPCILSIHFDITSQQEAQEALRAVAASYRGLFDSVSDAVYILDREGHFIDVNRGAVEMYGYSAEYFLKKTPRQLSAPERNDLDKVMRAIELAHQGAPQKLDFWGLRKNGEVFPKEVRLNKGMYFGEEVVFALAQDITEKKQAEAALRRRESILEAIAYASEQFLKVTDWLTVASEVLAHLGSAGEASRCYIFRNHAGLRGTLLTSQLFEWCAPGITEQINNSNLTNFNYSEQNFDFLKDVLSDGQVLSSLVNELPESMQSEFRREDILSVLNVPIFANNRWWGFIGYEECTYERVWSQPEIEALKAAAGILGAVIERTEAAKALSRSEERYRMLVEQASDGIFIADLDGRFLNFNQSGSNMLGHPSEELIGMSIADVFDAEQLERKQLRLPSLEPGETITTELVLHRKDGSSFPAELSAKRLPNNTIQGFIRDITERRKALDAQERQLKELSILQALASAGTNARDEDELIEQATGIIGRTIYTDILGILLVTEDGRAFYPHPSYRGVAIQDWKRIYGMDEGVTGWVIKHGQTVKLDDVAQSKHYMVFNAVSRSELCVPMKIGERVIGAINAESSKPNYFTIDDERLLITIAGQLATAIERIRNAAAERDQRVLAEALRDTAETLNNTLEVNAVLDRILENIGRVVPSETAMIMLLEGNIAHPIRHRGFDERGDHEWIESLRVYCDYLGDFKAAIETRQPQLIADTELIDGWFAYEESRWIRSHLLAPIINSETVTGFIALDHNQPRFFTDHDKERLFAFANQAATALQNARLFESERLRRREAETLREATAVVATTLNSNQAVNLILEQLARVLQYDSASVQLLRDGYLEIVGGRGWISQDQIIGMKFRVPGENPNSEVVQKRIPVVVESTRRAMYHFQEPPHSHILSWVGVPLIARGEIIGMLAIDSTHENYFNEEHARLASAFANQAAIAIENARLYEQNEEQIRRLTSLRDIDTAIASSLDLRVTLNILVDQAMTQLQPDAMDILIYNPHLQTLDIAASAGFHTAAARRQNRIGDGMAGSIAVNRRSLQIPHLSDRKDLAYLSWITDEKFVYYSGVPLLGKGQIKGVLEVFFRSEATPLPEWLDFLQTIAGQAAIAIDNAQLFENLQRSNQELSLAYDTTLEGWGKALELRDKETEGHTRRVADLTIQLARRMGIGEAEITHIRRGVLLHDIGKMGVPDHILRKTGPLNDEEWKEMRQHPQYAYDLLHPITYLRPALDIPYGHHEKWDGTGYPRGLKGTEIPLSARIFAVVDVWDALLSDRPYRPSWTRQETINYIRKEAGTRFDPNVVQVFLNMIASQE